jgi:translation initiation factor 1A
LGKRKVISEAGINEQHIPQENEVLGISEKLLGYDRIMVRCQDGTKRLCRIRGKMKRRVWIRLNDVVLVAPWDFQSDTRGDIIWRYKGNQAEWLRSSGYLKM